MPPTGALSSEQIGIIKAWIDQGAEWPDELAGETPAPAQDPKAAQLRDALRRGDRAAFEKLLRENPKAGQAKGSGRPDGPGAQGLPRTHSALARLRLRLHSPRRASGR